MPDLNASWLARLSATRQEPPQGDSVRARRGTERAAVSARTRTDPAEAVPWSVRAMAAWSWRVLVIVAAGAAVVYAVITFQTVVVSFLAALLLAVLLEPFAGWLRRRLHFPRALASLTAILAAVVFVGGLLVLAGRSIYNGFGELADRAVQGFNELTAWLAEGPLGISEDQIDQWMSQLTDQVRANSDVLVSGVANVTGSVTTVVTGALIAVFCLFFFLKEGRRIWQWFVRLAPRTARERINESGIRAWVTLGGYARTQILVAFVDAVGIALGAIILGIPLALPIGVLVFLGAFIPIVGALLSGTVAVLVALVDQGLVTAVIMLLIVLAVQQIEGNLLQPWLQSNALALHPIAILLAVTAGTGIAGILGALFAVPVVAVLNTVVLYLHGHDKYPQLATDLNRPGGPPGAVTSAIEEDYAHMGEEVGMLEDLDAQAPTFGRGEAAARGGEAADRAGEPGAPDGNR
ncbi:AI-2E family transporter [Georgenia sp. AZ-5]|uniref:AI-2E family transporter n=1 Tax=Georgenia sp. AZ-5 TaxID=3367526 RepID=UPI0037547C6C